MGLNAKQETEAIETTLRRLRAEARKAEAERDDDEIARLRELRDAVRAWVNEGPMETGAYDRLIALERRDREATQ